MIEHKSVPFELVKADVEGRTFEGYASVFRDPTKDLPDATGDMVVKGAFKRTISERGHKVRMLWQHDPQQPIGRFTDLREDSKGLFVKGMVSDTRLGRDALALLRDGAIDSMSIGYDVAPSGADFAKVGDGKTVRLLKEVRLWEVSLVSFPADEAAKVTALKAEDAPPADAAGEPLDLSVKAVWEARWEEAKQGQRLNRAYRQAMRQIQRMLTDMLRGYEDEGDEETAACNPDDEDRPRKPTKTEYPPVGEAESSPEQTGPDSTPDEHKAGDATIPPTEESTSAGPDADSPTSSQRVSDAESADPLSDIRQEMAEVKALLDWR